MTRNACEFITPLTLETLSNNLVVTHMFEGKKTYEVEHISLAGRADLLLVAPATSNIISKVASGTADDMLSTVIAATPQKTPVVFAPAMNDQMWKNPILQKNINELKQDVYQSKYHFEDPIVGRLSCGYEAQGVLAKPKNIVEKVVSILNEEE